MQNSNPNIMNNNKPHAILVAYPLQGHIIPTVQLAIKLASKGFSITFINTESIHNQITRSNPTVDDNENLFSEVDKDSNLDISYITVSDGLPLEYDRSLNHDHWIGAMLHTYPAYIEAALAKIVESRPSTCCLIADTSSVWASTVAKKFGLFYVSFWTEAALVLNIYSQFHLLKENGHVAPGVRKDIIDYIPGVKSLKTTDLMSYFQEEMNDITQQFIFGAIEDAKQADFMLGNTIQELEPDSTRAIQAQISFYPIGPLFARGFVNGPVATSLWAESDCTQWLDTKPHGSVLYVSFGSYAHISIEELVEIANGIKLSGVNFLWVIRPDMVSSDDPDPLPIEFRNEVSDRGIIVTWTNQIAVLSHPAVGGFLTHCGWNSTIESVWYEVPLLCFPLLTDQFTNRKLIVDDWNIGYYLCEEKPIRKEEVSQKIKQLLCESKGEMIQEKIKVAKKVLENAITSNGSSEKNFDTFINDLKLGVEKKLRLLG